MTNTTNPDRVWIEIEYSDDVETCKKRAALYTNMLNRLREPELPLSKVWYCERKNSYCFASDETGTFLYLEDNGHWFNLEYYGR